MADLPESTVSFDTSGALAILGDAFVMFFCAPQGDLQTPKLYGSAKALLTEFADCGGVDFGGTFIRKTRKPIVAVRLPTVTAGTVSDVDTTGVVGLCVITAAAHGNGIFDEVDFRLVFLNAGTVGADGLQYKYSFDGGKNYSPAKLLGVATTIDITRIGVRLSLTSATIVAGDFVTFYTTPAKPDSAGIAAAFTALKAHSTLFRGGIVIHEVDQTEAGLWQTALADYDAYGRPMWLLMSARDWYHDAKMQGKPSDVDFTGASSHTIVRNTGSFVADGFKVGMTVSGTSPLNSGVIGKLTSVVALTLTFASGVTTEANQDGSTFSLTAHENETDWVAKLASDFAAILYDNPLISIDGGRGRIFSDVLGSDFGAELRRPDAWGDAIREMQFGMQIMTSKTENGALTDWSIKDADGNTVEHDERLVPGLTQAGFGSFRTFDEPGVFITLPLMRATNPNSGLSRRPIVSVKNLFCQVVQKTLVKCLSREVQKKRDGTIAEVEAKRIELKVNSALKQVLLTTKNRLASGATWSMSRTDDLLVPGAIVNGDGELNSLGYIEQFRTRGRLASSVEV